MPKKEVNCLADKKIIVYGDSIVWGQTSKDSFSKNPWPSVVEELTGAKVVNGGIRGAILTDGEGYGITQEIKENAFVNRIDKENISDCDYILIAYGTNDYGNSIELGSKDIADKTTFCGALSCSLEYIYKKFPDKKVILLTPMYASNGETPNPRGYILPDYCAAIKEVASLYNTPVIDLYNNMGINEFNVAAMYWDQLHPTDKVYKMMGEYIAGALQSPSLHVDYNNIENVMPLTYGKNLLKKNDFEKLEDGTERNILLSTGETVTSKRKILIEDNKDYYLTLSYKAVKDGFIQVDFYNEERGTICYHTFKAVEGEHTVKLKLHTPETGLADNAYFRISNCDGERDMIVGSLMLSDDIWHSYSD